MPDALETEVSNALKNIVRRAEDLILEQSYLYPRKSLDRISDREDTRLAFTRSVREAVKRAGYKSPEEVWDMVMGSKKSGFEDGVKWAEHKVKEALAT